MADLSGVGAEIIYDEGTKTVTINYPNEIVQLERAPTPIIGKNLFIEEDDDIIPSSQNL